jgi:hypothetical protein
MRALGAGGLTLFFGASCAQPPSVPSPIPPPPTPVPAPIPAPAFSAEYPWQPDRLDGTFKNPVLYADYSDPDAVRVGDDCYMVASSFQCTPGLPILHSRDLVNWTLVGHALENLPEPRYAEVRHGEGIWAPSLREHAGKFFIFAPTPDEGIYVLTAPHPRGPWSKPKMLAAGKGLIDPCPLWDDDGKAYLVHAYARSRAGIRDRLRVRPMAPDATKLETAIEIEKLGAGGRAGLIVMGESHAALAVEEVDKRLRLSLIVDDAVRETEDMPRGRVLLRVHLDDGGLCRFTVRGDGESKFEGEFQAKPGRWIGTKVGLFATVPDGTKPRGQADFDYFRFATATKTR